MAMMGRLGMSGLVLAALGGAGGLIAAARLPLSVPDVTPVSAEVSASTPRTPIGPYDSAIARSALFRPGRVPAPIPFDPLGQQSPPAPAVAEPVPTFALVGLVLGGTPAAVIRGIPGQDGAHVMAEGEERGGVRVVRILGTGVTLTWRGDSVHVTLPREAR